MNELIKGIFIKIANKLGLEIKQKEVTTDDYFVVNDISLTAAMASRIATLALIDSDVNIAGDNQRATMLNEIMQEFENDSLKKAIEVALGTGDCLIKPYTDGVNISFDIIPSKDYVITDNVGRNIKSCLIKCDEFTEDNTAYTRVEQHTIRKYNGMNVLHINQYAFEDEDQISIASVPRWSDIEDVIIPNVDTMLFGRIVCPMTNREHLNSPNGVPITYGMDKVITNAVDAYNRFNDEMEQKEPIVFADKTILEPTDGKGRRQPYSMPKGKEKLFMKIRGGLNGEKLVETYSPDIRDASLKEGIMQNFRMLELLSGLSAGILTPPTTSFATATEIKSTLRETFSFMQRIRSNTEQAVKSMVDGANYIMNMNEITPMGDYEVIYSWSDSYVEDIAERFLELMQGEAIGAVTKAEVRAYVMNEPLTTAEEKLAEIMEKKTDVIIEEDENE